MLPRHALPDLRARALGARAPDPRRARAEDARRRPPVSAASRRGRLDRALAVGDRHRHAKAAIRRPAEVELLAIAVELSKTRFRVRQSDAALRVARDDPG